MGLFQVGGYFARDAGGRDQIANPVRARLRRAAIFTHHNCAVGDMVNSPRRDSVEANKTEAAKSFLRANDRRHRGFIAESILQSQHGGFRAGQRGEEPRQDVIGGWP